MLAVVKESLKQQSECPRCGANWKIIPDMLADGMQSWNYQLAMTIISNCDVCRARFEKERDNV